MNKYITMVLFVILLMGAGRYGQDLKLDSMTGTLQSIDYAHHEIHGGTSFTIYYTRTTAATDGHRSAIYFKTPPAGGKLCHVIASFSASTAANYFICEGASVDSNEGTNANAIYNRYRDSTTASGCYDNAASPAVNKYTTFTEVEIAAANFTTGTVLRTEPLVAGSGPKPAGGAGRDSQEYILKANTAYIFMIKNTAASANNHYILVDWYEH